MSKQTQSWAQRRARLAGLLGIPADEEVDEEGEAWMLDDHIWNTRALGRTPANGPEIDRLRFGERDVEGLGTVAKGQFGLVEVVRCRLDQQLYASKSIDKNLAWRAREQCFPHVERDILLRALTTNAKWVPHLLCAFQSADKLTMLMDYADGGNLWDIVESREQPNDSTSARIPESDLRWWMAQAACAIEWCHSQGYAHRDIKPHNFVFSHRTHHLRLVDFGSAAPLLAASRDGVQLVPKRLCLVPCGTCDYISPEILNAHEEALVALETEQEGENTMDAQYDPSQGGYGKEVDWWSFGAMFYELAFGVAPFYAKDIRKTYTKIIDHHRNLVFPTPRIVSASCVDLIGKLLCHHETRLGRKNAREVRGHAFFKGTGWATLHAQQAPPTLQLPQFGSGFPVITPTLPAEDSLMKSHDGREEDLSSSVGGGGGGGGSEQQPFDFSALFQSTMMTPGHPSSATRSKSLNDILGFRTKHTDTVALTAFIGFSWGPAIDAFSHPRPTVPPPPVPVAPVAIATPLPIRPQHPQSEPPPFVTPLRPGLNGLGMGMSPAPNTVPRSALRRGLSDREALRQLVGCVSVSARKRVLQSGRTPRLPMLRGVAFRNSDDGTSSRTSGEDETHPMPPSPSPSPRPSSRMSGRLTMLSVSTGTGGDRSRSASTPTFGPRSPFLQNESVSASTTVSDRSMLSQPRPRNVSPPQPPAEVSISAPPTEDFAIEDEEDALARRIDEMSARYSVLLSHISDLEQRIAQAAIPQHL